MGSLRQFSYDAKRPAGGARGSATDGMLGMSAGKGKAANIDVGITEFRCWDHRTLYDA